jgi:hypothetical protein
MGEPTTPEAGDTPRPPAPGLPRRRREPRPESERRGGGDPLADYLHQKGELA